MERGRSSPFEAACSRCRATWVSRRVASRCGEVMGGCIVRRSGSRLGGLRLRGYGLAGRRVVRRLGGVSSTVTSGRLADARLRPLMSSAVPRLRHGFVSHAARVSIAWRRRGRRRGFGARISARATASSWRSHRHPAAGGQRPPGCLDDFDGPDFASWCTAAGCLLRSWSGFGGDPSRRLGDQETSRRVDLQHEVWATPS